MRPAHRGKGIGKALMIHLARKCVENGWTRFQWSVLDWNTPSIDFYKSLGAELLDEWTGCARQRRRAGAARAAGAMMQIVLIAAVAENGVIGRGGTMPWRLKSDMRHFRALTIGQAGGDGAQDLSVARDQAAARAHQHRGDARPELRGAGRAGRAEPRGRARRPRAAMRCAAAATPSW